MANKVTGKTDTSGALTTAPIAPKSLIIVGTAGEDEGYSGGVHAGEGGSGYAVGFQEGIRVFGGKSGH